MIFYLLPVWVPGLFVGVIQVPTPSHPWPYFQGAFLAVPDPTFWSVFDLS